MIYNRKNIVQFLIALDSEVSHKMDLVIIGGASLSLAYNFNNVTIDMDLLCRITTELEDAIERARIKTHLDIKVSTTYVRADILNMDQRLFTPDSLRGLKMLTVLVPEKHDLALMKAARNEPRDIEDIEGLHAADKLDPATLLERFVKELLPLNSGDDNLLKQKFLEMIESLFGTELADEYEIKLP